MSKFLIRSTKVSNITLKIDEELLKKARRLALRRKTSINAIVKKGIEEFVSGDLSREAAVKGLEAFFQQTRARVGAKTWTRDELHISAS
jgi:predicted transcriptional regulator